MENFGAAQKLTQELENMLVEAAIGAFAQIRVIKKLKVCILTIIHFGRKIAVF